MAAHVRLLGPDLPTPLVVPVAVSDSVGRLKEIALENWPSGMDVPLAGQLRIIHQGRFLEDIKALRDHKVAEGETTAMHLIIKSEVSKPAESASSSDDKAPKCSCVIC